MRSEAMGRRAARMALVAAAAMACGGSSGRVAREARQGQTQEEDRPLVVEFWATWCYSLCRSALRWSDHA